MQGESLEVLEKADVPPAQARAIVRAIEIELAGAKDMWQVEEQGHGEGKLLGSSPSLAQVGTRYYHAGHGREKAQRRAR